MFKEYQRLYSFDSYFPIFVGNPSIVTKCSVKLNKYVAILNYSKFPKAQFQTFSISFLFFPNQKCKKKKHSYPQKYSLLVLHFHKDVIFSFKDDKFYFHFPDKKFDKSFEGCLILKESQMQKTTTLENRLCQKNRPGYYTVYVLLSEYQTAHSSCTIKHF